MTAAPPEQAGPILVVDDEADIRRLIEIELSDAGFDVLQAEDGASAVRLAAEQAPRLFIVDDLLPDMRGAELIEQLRQQSSAPVVVISGFLTEEAREEALSAGAAAHLAKPFDWNELLNLCRSLLA